MPVQINIPTLSNKIKAKIAELEKAIAERERAQKEFDQDWASVSKSRETARKAWKKEVAKILVKQIAGASLEVHHHLQDTVLMTVRVKNASSLALPAEPNYEALFPYPEMKRVDVPRTYRKNGTPVFADEQLSELKNNLAWLDCIEPGTTLTLSEYGRITAHL
jgi:hypothetical protein